MFSKFSSQFLLNNSVSLDYAFFQDFLPNEKGEYIKVFLYGLYFCSARPEATLSDFCADLNLKEDDVIECMYHFQDLGLVQVISEEPFQVKYMPIKSVIDNSRKYNKDEFINFNISAQELIKGRMIGVNEYTDYYTLLKSFNMTQEALLQIIKYCVDVKGNRVGSSYILAVAKDWAYAKILTEEAVLNKIEEMNVLSPELKDVFACLGLKRAPTYNDYNTYSTWKKEFNFSDEVILFVAKSLKHKGGMEKLHSKLVKCYELHLYSVKEIEDYYVNLNNMYDIAKVVCKNLGLYFENYEPVVENYVSKWLNLGFDEEMIKFYSSQCFLNGTRNLEGMDTNINKLYKLGIVSLQAYNQFAEQNIKLDESISKILSLCGLVRRVNSVDRQFYRVWKQDWNFSDEIIEYVASISVGKMQPMSYINKILADFKQNNILTLEQAKKSCNTKDVNNSSNFTPRSYSTEELNSVFANLDEVKIW